MSGPDATSKAEQLAETVRYCWRSAFGSEVDRAREALDELELLAAERDRLAGTDAWAKVEEQRKRLDKLERKQATVKGDLARLAADNQTLRAALRKANGVVAMMEHWRGRYPNARLSRGFIADLRAALAAVTAPEETP